LFNAKFQTFLKVLTPPIQQEIVVYFQKIDDSLIIKIAASTFWTFNLHFFTNKMLYLEFKKSKTIY